YGADGLPRGTADASELVSNSASFATRLAMRSPELSAKGDRTDGTPNAASEIRSLTGDAFVTQQTADAGNTSTAATGPLRSMFTPEPAGGNPVSNADLIGATNAPGIGSYSSNAQTTRGASP